MYGFARRHGLRVIDDVAHVSAARKGRKIGSFGDLACFNFDGLKNITSGEGGAVVTAEMGLFNQFRMPACWGRKREHGKTVSGRPESGV